MTRAGKAVLIIVLLASAMLLAIVIVGVYWYKVYGGEFMNESKRTVAEGRELGRKSGEQACLSEAEKRIKRVSGFGEGVQTNVFLRACLTAADREPTFCKGVPGPFNFIDSAHWQQQRCQDLGMQRNQYCVQMYAEVQQHCARSDAKPADPTVKD